MSQRESPIHHSNVMHFSKEQNVRSRLGKKYVKGVRTTSDQCRYYGNSSYHACIFCNPEWQFLFRLYNWQDLKCMSITPGKLKLRQCVLHKTHVLEYVWCSGLSMGRRFDIWKKLGRCWADHLPAFLFVLGCHLFIHAMVIFLVLFILTAWEKKVVRESNSVA